MKQVFLVLVAACLIACDNDPEIHIMGTQFDFTDDTQDQVDAHPTDSTSVFGPFLPGEKDDPTDSLTTVSELLDYLETIPTNE